MTTDPTVPRLTARFNELSQRLPDEDIEFWFARALMKPLGYARWENFTTVIQRTMESCKSIGFRNSTVKINVDQIFKLLSPSTEVKCI